MVLSTDLNVGTNLPLSMYRRYLLLSVSLATQAHLCISMTSETCCPVGQGTISLESELFSTMEEGDLSYLINELKSQA